MTTTDILLLLFGCFGFYITVISYLFNFKGEESGFFNPTGFIVGLITSLPCLYFSFWMYDLIQENYLQYKDIIISLIYIAWIFSVICFIKLSKQKKH